MKKRCIYFLVLYLVINLVFAGCQMYCTDTSESTGESDEMEVFELFRASNSKEKMYIDSVFPRGIACFEEDSCLFEESGGEHPEYYLDLMTALEDRIEMAFPLNKELYIAEYVQEINLLLCEMEYIPANWRTVDAHVYGWVVQVQFFSPEIHSKMIDNPLLMMLDGECYFLYFDAKDGKVLLLTDQDGNIIGNW